MRSVLLVAAALALGLVGPVAALAQPAPGATETPSAPARTRRAPSADRPAREPTAGQLAARERQRSCGAEWRKAKAAGDTGGLKWPQYWSRCNARLKGANV